MLLHIKRTQVTKQVENIMRKQLRIYMDWNLHFCNNTLIRMLFKYIWMFSMSKEERNSFHVLYFKFDLCTMFKSILLSMFFFYFIYIDNAQTHIIMRIFPMTFYREKNRRQHGYEWKKYSFSVINIFKIVFMKIKI